MIHRLPHPSAEAPKPLRALLCAMAAAAALGACSGSTDLYTGMSERDANEITAALSDHGIDASKDASGKQLYAIRVPKKDFSQAVAILQATGLPRNAFSRMGEIFKKDGMISTPTEERARFLYALSQELENTLSQIDGVVAARVHPVLPERIVPGDPVLPSSCSILIKHVPGLDTAAYEPLIRKLVLTSIPGLAEAPDKITVVFVPAEPPAVKPERHAGASAMEAASGRDGSLEGWLVAAGALVLGVGGPCGWLWWQRRRDSARRAAGEASADVTPVSP